MIDPTQDGITHINVYSQSQTALGRFLSNFANTPLETEDGKFNSIEGYWYWLSCRDDQLRTLHGWKAKSIGRKLKGKDWSNDPEFKRKIKLAIKTKLESNPKWLKALQQTTLPLEHYYVYGDQVIQPKNGHWILEWIGKIKEGTAVIAPKNPELF